MSETEQINREVLKLWNDQFGRQASLQRWPLIYPEPVQHGLVVVGCNPAMPPESNYYQVPNFEAVEVTDEIIKKLASQETKARNDYPYYEPFHRLAQELGLPFEHVDLFFYRVSNQEVVKSLMTTDGENLNDFGNKQVQFAKKLVELAKPRIILVANAFAARIFKKQFALSKLDDDGLYWVPLNRNRVPVFLSGVFKANGRQVLDSHTYERLVWHMKRALKLT
jgi:hypothetical protein